LVSRGPFAARGECRGGEVRARGERGKGRGKGNAEGRGKVKLGE